MSDGGLDVVLDLVMRLARGEPGVRGEIRGEDATIDGLVTGLNMLAEELEYATGRRIEAERGLRARVEAYEAAAQALHEDLLLVQGSAELLDEGLEPDHPSRDFVADLVEAAGRLGAQIDALPTRAGAEGPPPPEPDDEGEPAATPPMENAQSDLPRAEPPEVPKAAPALPPASGASKTVLIVDDEPLVLAVLKRMLRSENYELLFATDGEHALSVLDAHSGEVHLLLTDDVMPKMDGSKLAQTLWDRGVVRRVIFMSGNVCLDREVQGAPEGAVRLLNKPFTPQGLLSAVREALASD